MSEKKKVLIITERFNYGGMDLVALRLSQALDKNKFDCVFCAREEKQRGTMDEFVNSKGINVIYQPENRLSYKESYKFYKELFDKEHFDIVHSHYPFFSAIPMYAAYKSGIKVRVAHSHFSGQTTGVFSKPKQFAVNIYRNVMRAMISKFSTAVIGCSKEAGEYLAGKAGFAKKGIVLNNGINITDYKYDRNTKDKVKREFNIEGKIVLGHIGMLYYIKNQNFIIDIFYEFQKKHPESVLMLVGDGKDREELENKCRELNLTDKVIFTGIRDDVPQLLCAMDCMIFPSLKEGFPLTLIEAQASELSCIVSDTVIKEVRLNSNVEFMSLNDTPQQWADKAYELCRIDRESIDISAVEENFDINKVAKQLEQIYSA